MFFSASQLERAEVPELGAQGLAAWWVTLPGISYRGRAVCPASWDVEQVLAALELGAKRCGSYDVLAGRLYSRLRIDQWT
ncbi:hypothetical protein GKE82_24170 [Conexibacter sp. W3-3-2]|uniref:hypothetical protein n=1 Tax=Conexibacter sp. W3-3-2 TaxID=2675227 RepID=UPI0012B71990|nr:hypothetical protein [Conexibacter sp. W3-3-2]MTD47305.1 hypothetical protein [Conexibacter sp. W3-3-2]